MFFEIILPAKSCHKLFFPLTLAQRPAHAESRFRKHDNFRIALRVGIQEKPANVVNLIYPQP